MKTVKQILMAFVIGITLFQGNVFAASVDQVDVEIEGMTCKFCAYSVQKNLSKLAGVELAEVNIESKKAHIVMAKGHQADIEQIKKKISEAGFTAVKVTVGSSK